MEDLGSIPSIYFKVAHNLLEPPVPEDQMLSDLCLYFMQVYTYIDIINK